MYCFEFSENRDYFLIVAVTVEEQIVRQLTEKRMKELDSSISDTRREY